MLERKTCTSATHFHVSCPSQYLHSLQIARPRKAGQAPGLVRDIFLLAQGAEAQGNLNRRSEFSRWALRGLLSSSRCATALTFDGTDGDACMEMQPVCIPQQLFDADLRDPTSEQIAHRRLVLIQNVRELRLCVALRFDMFQDGGQEFSLDLECARFRPRESQRIEGIASHNMCRPIFDGVFHDSSAPLIAL